MWESTLVSAWRRHLTVSGELNISNKTESHIWVYL